MIPPAVWNAGTPAFFGGDNPACADDPSLPTRPLFEACRQAMHRDMSNEIDIRKSQPTDRTALEELYRLAFPDEDLVPLLRELLNEEHGVFSFVATSDAEPVGHIVVTMCGVGGHREKVGLLGPLAVSPRVQGRGIGSALIREGLRRLKGEGAVQVQVLGDPAYYGRFGFQPDNDVSPPYEIPREWRTAWQSIVLRDKEPGLAGTLTVPQPWRRPALWAP